MLHIALINGPNETGVGRVELLIKLVNSYLGHMKPVAPPQPPALCLLVERFEVPSLSGYIVNLWPTCAIVWRVWGGSHPALLYILSQRKER